MSELDVAIDLLQEAGEVRPGRPDVLADSIRRHFPSLVHAFAAERHACTKATRSCRKVATWTGRPVFVVE